MLTPLSEADAEGPFFQLCRASHALYPGFVAELEKESGVNVGYSSEGLICLASTEDAAEALHRQYEWQKRASFDLEVLTAAEVYKMEPLITLPVVSALFVPGERSVEPRRLSNALREVCLKRGIEIRTGVHVDGISAAAVQAGDLRFEASSIIIASGVWSPELRGLKPPFPYIRAKDRSSRFECPMALSGG